MTIPTATAHPTTAPEQAAVPAAAPVLRHRGCYWDVMQAAWVAWTPVPLPRPARD